MRRRHVVVFRVLGITPSDSDVKIPVPANGYECVITQNPDPWLEASDRASAIGSLVLRSMFMGDTEPLKEAPEDNIEAEAARLREERAAKKQPPNFVVLYCTDEANVDLPQRIHETDRYVVCFDAIDKAAFRESRLPEVAQSITSLALTFPHMVGLEQVRDVVDLHREDGKQFVSLNIKTSGNLTVSRTVHPNEIIEAESVANTIQIGGRMTRVEIQLMEALSSHGDDLRRFLSAFFALECFVNQAFKLCEPRLYDSICQTRASTVHIIVDHIRSVMPQHCNLAHRFALVAGQLDPNSSKSDFEAFKNAKSLRDRFSHGESVNEAALPVNEVLRILRKYLALHLGLKAH